VNRGRDEDSQDALRDDPIDVGGYAAALRRHIVLILVIVTLCTSGAFVAAQLWPPTYAARAELLILAGQGGTPEALNQELATLESLTRTSTILAPAAERLGVDVSELRGRIDPEIQGQASILGITGRGTSAEQAQETANAVVEALVRQRRDAESARLQETIENLSAAIDALRSTGSENEQRSALIQRRAELTVAAATAGDDLVVAQEAELPTEPVTPQPVRDTAIAFFVSLALAVLLALARDRAVARRPRVEPGGGQ
jgi:uncharacterized protein involved in exopolysaccharide biosynthesis